MKKTTLTWYRRLEKHERGKGRWKYETTKEMRCFVNLPTSASAENNYIHLAATTTGDRRMVLLVRFRYRWDGPSGPTWDRSQNMRASLFHDALCQLIGESLLDKKYRKYADQLFRQHLLEDGMGKFWAWGYYLAVRAWSKLKGM